MTRVTTSITGRSFQTGRPSSTSWIRFIARPNEPTYPEADHRAVSRPITSATPAPGVLVSCSRVGPSVLATPASPLLDITLSRLSTIFGPWPTSPSSDSTAMTAGKSASTA